MEEDMLKKVKNGDSVAMAHMVKEYRPVVERFLYQFGVSPNDIADITQLVFIKVVRSLMKYKGGTFTTWLYKIALNASKDHFRKTKREQEKVILMKSQLATQNHWRDPENEILHEAIQQLDEKYKTPIILYYFHDLSYEEMADVLACPIGSVKTRLHRGKQKLKDELNRKGEEYRG